MDGLGLVAPVAAVGATVYIAGSIAVGIGRWFADVYRGLALIAGGSGTSEMEVLDRRIALADIVAITALADEQVDEAEQNVMRALVEDDPRLHAELRDAFTRWHPRRAVLDDPEQRAQSLRTAAAALGESQRGALRELVAAMPVPERQETGATPYRASPSSAAAVREELLAALGAAG